MKKIFLIIAFASFSMHSFAQELNNKMKTIPAKDPAVKEIIPPKETSSKVNPPAAVEKPEPLNVDPEQLFKDTNLYKQESNVPGVFYRRNQFLGNFNTNAVTSTVMYRDAAFVDGDKVKVYLNDKIVEPEVSLDGEFKSLKINLEKGINKIDIEALNEGFASPNTAEFKVIDDKGTVISASEWNVGTGYKAVIVLVKE